MTLDAAMWNGAGGELSSCVINTGLAKFDWKVVAHWATKYNNLVAQQ